NGAGKTTILNIISAFLSKEWYRLYRYPFEIIECSINERIYSFENKKDLLYDKEKFRNFVRDKGNASTEKSDAIKILEAKSLKFLVENEFNEKFLFVPKNSDLKDEEMDLEEYDAKSLSEYLNGQYEEYTKSIYSDLESFKKMRFYPILFLPTYRVIERDAAFLLDTDIEGRSKSLDKEMITEIFEFGMGKVSGIIDDFSKKEKSKLIDFIELCNGYFSEAGNKSFFWDEAENEVILQQKDSKIFFDDLSSGEKQIVSIFSYLLLLEKDFFVIIDEPEISLSLVWQKKILSDIMNYSKGFLCATHSPFVSKDEKINEYQYMLEYFKE
ncbi:MAG TPA: AAA family ATPase, partial [Leptospiraceae bacterium]|nr:AAA family ATPase [Leptospiraceae bacterium]